MDFHVFDLLGNELSRYLLVFGVGCFVGGLAVAVFS